MPTDEMTTQEVAAFLACAASFVRQLRLDGRLPAKRRVGPTWVYDHAEVIGFKAAWDRRRTGRPVAVRTPPKNGKSAVMRNLNNGATPRLVIVDELHHKKVRFGGA